MPQAFDRRANTVAKAGIVAVLVLIVAGLSAVIAAAHSPWASGQGEAPSQPVPYSHAQHVGELGIDCRYCHASVETSPSAGIPPTKTCMNCHSLVATDSASLELVRASFENDTRLVWKRVHDLADFVYFDHSIHVAKGVGCTSCHGQVDEMDVVRQEESLQMDWCLSCHTQPEAYVRPRSEVFNMDYVQPENQLELGRALVEEYDIQRLTDCTVCHR